MRSSCLSATVVARQFSPAVARQTSCLTLRTISGGPLVRRQSHPAVGISRVSLKISAAWQSKVCPSLCPVFINFADLYSTGETRDKLDERPPHDSWSASTDQGGEQGHSKATSEAHEWVVYYASVEEVAIHHDTRSECEALRQRAHLVPVFLRSPLVHFHRGDEHLSIHNGSLWK